MLPVYTERKQWTDPWIILMNRYLSLHACFQLEIKLVQYLRLYFISLNEDTVDCTLNLRFVNNSAKKLNFKGVSNKSSDIFTQIRLILSIFCIKKLGGLKLVSICSLQLAYISKKLD
ncbi:hypothetical protein BpHYR1_007910 [Brachionus plicatilis]|uniref:Uncharacterized protein n=1 Tax=Brachionus plicatilis TaxID=10195 RepID=A0A3M7QIR9_BRAPC|nr:hypothetical protein BpHYR1_007910 [Brachionus plicatilis]